MPTPLANIADPFPARVATTPLGVTLRMRLLKMSATITLPLASTATPVGKLNEVFAPVPSANAYGPLPASVAVTPPCVTMRMRLFPESATITLPLASTATPEGKSNEAPTPVPSANARVPLPASVLTTPTSVTLRMRLFCWSATITLPLASTATPVG